MADGRSIVEAADRAHAKAAAYTGEHWTEDADVPAFDGSALHPARVWRRSKAQLIEGGVAPFKTEGIVVGASPQVLAVALTDIAMKDHERHKPQHERSTERRMVRQLDFYTKVWFEVDPYPWPLAAREMLYVERWTATEGGARVVLARLSIDLPEIPVGRGRVRAQSYVVQEMVRCAAGTTMSLCMEFNVGGNIPGRLVNAFLNGQTHTFRNLSGLFASEDGKRRAAEAEQQLRDAGQPDGGNSSGGASGGVSQPRYSSQPRYDSQQRYSQQRYSQQRYSQPATSTITSAAPPAAAAKRRPRLLQAVACLVAVCGLALAYRRRQARLLPPTGQQQQQQQQQPARLLSLAATHTQRALASVVSLLGPGWFFFVAAVGSGVWIVGDMVLVLLQTDSNPEAAKRAAGALDEAYWTTGPMKPVGSSSGGAARVETSKDGRRAQRRGVPAFWQNLQDYRLAAVAPQGNTSNSCTNSAGGVQHDQDGFQLPIPPAAV
jgi:hypothetical protein